jgi:hypothetical protein
MKTMNSVSVEEIISVLLHLAPHIRISHHEPGRIKLKLDFSALRLMGDHDLANRMRAIPGILHSRTQLLSRSVVVDYDEEKLPFELWETLGRLRDNPQNTGRMRAMLAEALGDQFT